MCTTKRTSGWSIPIPMDGNRHMAQLQCFPRPHFPVWLGRWHTYAQHIGLIWQKGNLSCLACSPIRRTQAWTKSAMMLQKSLSASCVERLRTAAAVASI